MTNEKKLHSEYSMSSSKRWMECPASIRLAALAPTPPEHPSAKNGTDGHTCLETFLRKLEAPAAVGNFLRKKFSVEMVEHARQARSVVVNSLIKHPGAELLVEARVNTSHITDKGNFGTVDVAIVELFGELLVMDYKYGVMPVDPRENTQMIGYALGIAKKYDYNFSHVTMVIMQPRGRTKEHWVREWKVSMKKLRAWEKIFREKVKATKDPNAPIAQGAWCFFCPSRTFNCPAHVERATAKAQNDFEFDDPEEEELEFEDYFS